MSNSSILFNGVSKGGLLAFIITNKIRKFNVRIYNSRIVSNFAASKGGLFYFNSSGLFPSFQKMLEIFLIDIKDSVFERNKSPQGNLAFYENPQRISEKIQIVQNVNQFNKINKKGNPHSPFSSITGKNITSPINSIKIFDFESQTTVSTYQIHQKVFSGIFLPSNKFYFCLAFLNQ